VAGFARGKRFRKKRPKKVAKGRPNDATCDYGVLLLLVGCGEADSLGRYQLAVNTAGSVWRLDTKTGEVAICAVEIGAPPLKVNCYPNPATAPAPKK
jgi:hypothetical protein